MLITSRTLGGRCPVCGGEHAACGPPSGSVPIDETWEVAAVGGPLKRYKVTTPHGVETVMKLNEADAERLGGELVEEVTDHAPAAAQPGKLAAKKRAAPANKARTTTSNKESS